MKKLKQLKSKIIMFIFALLLPLSAATTVAYTTEVKSADADTSSTNYFSSYTKEVSVTNGNFNSSASTYLNTSPSGWTKQEDKRRATAGVIHTGSNFDSNMASNYYLSNNPGVKDTADKHILMINSRTSSTSDHTPAKEGFKSSAVSLKANSYYSFSVSFKSDTNYTSKTTYISQGEIGVARYALKTNFENAKEDENGRKFVIFSHNSANYYVEKIFTSAATIDADKTLAKTDVFYEGEDYVGFHNGDSIAYVRKDEITKNDDNSFSVAQGTETFACNLAYNKSTARYDVNSSELFYKTKTEYTAIADETFGSVYLDGLTDAEGKTVAYTQIRSKDWTTLNFYVATGSEDKTVAMELWLGTREAGSSGVVFFDDFKVYQHSENAFWTAYNTAYDNNYFENKQNGVTTLTSTRCTSLVDLRETDIVDTSSNNFDFETVGTTIQKWTVSGEGHARAFNTKAPQYFETTTGYEFVGSPLDCKVTLDEDNKATITANNYVLGLWAENNSVKVTSAPVTIKSNKLYRVSATYKVSEITKGSVYMFISENRSVLNEVYNLSEEYYTLTEEKASSGTTSNGDSEFNNKYATIEFYVQGNALYDSSINISLGLGKSDETATGCVVFDNVRVEETTSAKADGATNKIVLNESKATPSVSNGNFNKVTTTTENVLGNPQNWTINKGEGLTFNGVINTYSKSYQDYVDQYNNFAGSADENPYLWAKYSNPLNSENSSAYPDNILMLANETASWQTVRSEEIALEANKTYKLFFDYKTTISAPIKVTIQNANGVNLFESEELCSNGAWTDEGYAIYFKSFAGAEKIIIQITFGSQSTPVKGLAFLDNFAFISIEETLYNSYAKVAEANKDIYGVADFSNLYLNIPTNTISKELDFTSVTPAYSSDNFSGDKATNKGTIVNSAAFAGNEVFEIEGDERPVFYLTNQAPGSYTFESKFALDLTTSDEGSSYYKLTFTVKTFFNYLNDGVSLDEDKTYDYGIAVGLTGYDYLQTTSNEEHTTYTIYYKPSEATSANLHIALISDAAETQGSAIVYDVKFETATEDDYNLAKDMIDAEDYDLNEDKVMIAEVASEDGEEDDSTEEETPEEDKEETPSNNEGFSWLLLASTLITGLAILVALVGLTLKKVKIKKIERKKQASYDRKSSLDIDVIKVKARKQRDEEAEALETQIKTFKKELENLEKTHKKRVLELREKDKGQVSKETDSEFKQFAKKRTVVAEKVDSLGKQLETVKSPDYLLNLEKKIYAQEDLKRRKLVKDSKKASKK